MTSSKQPFIKETVDRLFKRTVGEAYVATPQQFPRPAETVSRETRVVHDELYKGYISKFNRTSAELDAVSRGPDGLAKFRALKIDETHAMNAVYLHELFFANSGDANSQLSMDSLAYMRLQRDWGTFGDWQRDLLACAMAARQGWAATGFSVYLRRYHNAVIDSHDIMVPVGFVPIVVIDMHEHARLLDHKNDRESYVTQIISELRWNVIESRIEQIERVL